MELINLKSFLTLEEPTPQNGQTHSNNSSAISRHFVGLALKGLIAEYFEVFH